MSVHEDNVLAHPASDNFHVKPTMSDKIVVENLEKLQDQKCQFEKCMFEKVERTDYDWETKVKWRINSQKLSFCLFFYTLT